MIDLHVNGDNIIYFASLGVEYIPTEIKQFINSKNTIASIFRTQYYESVM